MIVESWLKELTTRSSDTRDDVCMQYFLRETKIYPDAICTNGLVHPYGDSKVARIGDVAKAILETIFQEEKEE